MNSCELTLAIAALANVIASNFNDEELGVLAAVTTTLGDLLATILAQRALCESLKNENQTSASSTNSSTISRSGNSDSSESSDNSNNSSKS